MAQKKRKITMRKVTLSTGKDVSVSPLTGKQVRELRNTEAAPGFDGVFATVEMAGFGPDVTDDMPFPDILAINKAIGAETFGIEEEAKN